MRPTIRRDTARRRPRESLRVARPAASASRTLMPPRFRTLALHVLLLLAALQAAVAAPAVAADGDVERTIAVLELRTGADASSQTTDYLREVVAAFKDKKPGDFILVPMDKLAGKLGRSRDQVPGAVTEDRKKQLAEAKKKGISYLDNADAANAIKALSAAERAYGSALAAPGADETLRKDYLDVLAQLATAYVVAKDNDAAVEVFRIVITTFGLKAPVTDDFYRPDVVEKFQRVVKETNTLQKGSLDVSSTPLGARIILSGGDRGATPGQVADLIAGTYALRLQHGSSTSLLHRVKINGGQNTKINIDVPFESHLVLDGPSVGLTYADLDAAKLRLENDAVVLGRDLEVNLVVLLGVIDQKLVTYVVDVSQGKVERSFQVKVPQVGVSPRAITRAIETILGKEGAAAPAPAPATDPWYTYTPGVAAGGAGAVALIVGLVFSPAIFAIEAKNEAEKASLESNRTIAGATLAIGAILGGVAGYLFWNRSNVATAAEQAGSPAPVGLPPAAFGFAPVHFGSVPAQTAALPSPFAPAR
ncbi:MAG: PEGA domain-containing protein [Myxococcales bacterium]|nr:PEGA domain-containing protein [Myxococcales bacterium]